MCKCHVVYESRPRSVIVTLGGKIYRIPETIAPHKVSQGRKISSHIRKLFLFTIASEGEHKITETSTPFAQGVYSLDTRRRQSHCFLIYMSTSMMQGHAFKVLIQKKIIHTTITAFSGCQRKESSSLQQMSHQEINSTHSSGYDMGFDAMETIAS